MSDREARDAAMQRLDDAVGDLIREKLTGALHPWRESMAIEDVYAITDGLIESIHDAGIEVASREKIAAYLMSHIGGDESQPWQAGHNYAMTEAARLVRERWDEVTQ